LENLTPGLILEEETFVSAVGVQSISIFRPSRFFLIGVSGLSEDDFTMLPKLWSQHSMLM